MKQLFRPNKAIYIESIGAVHSEGQLNDAGWMEVIPPDYKKVIPDPRLRRRMSRIIRMGVAAANQATANFKKTGRTLDAIITASGLGCLTDTESFLNSIRQHDENALSPTPFISSTFNAIGAQIALLGDYTCYNTTYVQRFFSFESALFDALLLLDNQEANTILIGAVDEANETLHTLYQMSGFDTKIPLGEGASFFLLSTQPQEQAIAELVELMISDEENKSNSNSDFMHSGIYFTATAEKLYHTCQLAKKTTDLLTSTQSYGQYTSSISIKPL